MHPATTVKTHLFLPPNSLPALSSRALPVSVFAVCRSRVVVVGGGGCGGREQEKTGNVLSLHCAAPLKEEGPLLGFLDARKNHVRDSCWDFDGGFVRRCSKDWGSEGDSALEAEILEFMKNSENPNLFPSKKQLIDAGRTDLVMAVARQGGWMASGWDLEGYEKKFNSDPDRSHEVPARISPKISLEIAPDDDSGIDGILSRLEIIRNRHKGDRPNYHPAYDEPSKASKTPTVADIKGNSEPAPPNDRNGRINDSQDKPNDLSQLTDAPIKTRLRQMESKLSALLNMFKSDTGDNVSHKASESSSDKHLKHYDAWEFQETGIMSRQKKLRSIRAKIAIVEGRMALAMIDAQRLVEQKQKRIDDTRKGIQRLSNAYIVWHSEASEVLVAGSFDGWATQRKMFRSSTTIFSLPIKLYPGQYEIKFVVDGVWKVDPLRPVVQHDGYVNNLFIVD